MTEEEANTDDYTTTASGASGEIVSGETAAAEYMNYRGTTPPTNPNEPGGGTPPGTTEIPENPTPTGGTPPIENITDEPTPLSSFNMLENIEDEDVPLAFMAPMTGDEAPTGAAALFSLMALGMMGAFGILGFKKDEEDA